MRTNYILVDLENVQPESLELLNHDHVRVIVFVGARQIKIYTRLAVELQKFGDRGSYVQATGSGKNALDFLIAFSIGELSAKDERAYFHIISKDAGFDPLIQYLKQRKITVGRVASIVDVPFVKSAASRSPEERVQYVVDRLNLPKATRPRTVRTLSSSINAHFQKSLSDVEVKAIVDGLVKRKFIMLLEDQVVYNVAIPPKTVA